VLVEDLGYGDDIAVRREAQRRAPDGCRLLEDLRVEDQARVASLARRAAWLVEVNAHRALRDVQVDMSTLDDHAAAFLFMATARPQPTSRRAAAR
jgi:hypothetical protein